MQTLDLALDCKLKNSSAIGLSRRTLKVKLESRSWEEEAVTKDGIIKERINTQRGMYKEAQRRKELYSNTN